MDTHLSVVSEESGLSSKSGELLDPLQRMWSKLPLNAVMCLRFLWILAIVSPWMIFALLCAGQGCRTMTKIAGGLSAFIVLCFGSLSKPHQQQYVDDADVIECLYDFGHLFNNKYLTDFSSLLMDISAADRQALIVLGRLSEKWKSACLDDVSSDREGELCTITKSSTKPHHLVRSGSNKSLDSMGSAVGSVKKTLSRQGSANSIGNTSVGSYGNYSENKGGGKTLFRQRSGASVTFEQNGDSSPQKLKFQRSKTGSSSWRSGLSVGIKKSKSMATTASDFSGTSFSDFNHRNAARTVGNSTPLCLELDLPTPGAASKRMPCDLIGQHIGGSEAGNSGVSYHSVDGVVSDGGSKGELISAEVASLGQGPSGMTRVRIEFRSLCLRTRNEWQKSLLAQQKFLLDLVATELKNTKEELRKAGTMHEDEKALLRNFRKIVAKEVIGIDDMDEVRERIVVIVIDENESICTSIREHCQNLEYRFHQFADVSTADAHLQCITQPMSPSKKKDEGIVPLGLPRQFTQALQQVPGRMLPLILISASLLDKIPTWWKGDDVTVALTSDAESFEDVGRFLLASGEAEVRERLRKMGITEYLFHPLSMNAFCGVVSAMLRTRLGDEYLLVDTLGRGSSAVVYRVRRLQDGEVFALKEISKRRYRARSSNDLNNEVRILKDLCWPSIVSLTDEWFSNKDGVQYIVMPLLAGGSILQQIQSTVQNRCLELWLEWYAQTLHALSYLHWRGVLHLDIKPANLFLGTDVHSLQVGDFGSARYLSGPGPHPARSGSVPGFATTVAYQCPGFFSTNELHASSDLWSLGITIVEVLTLELPHRLPEAANKNPKLVDSANLVANVHQALLKLSSNQVVNEDMIRELSEFLCEDPMARPSAIELTLRPHILQCLRRALSFHDTHVRDAHFAKLNVLLQDCKMANQDEKFLDSSTGVINL